MYQGGRLIEQRNWSTANYRVDDLKGMFITHAHIDHSGLVPRLVRQGYSGPIYATEATCDLLSVLWLDSAHIQEMESQWQTRKNKRKGRTPIEPLYETADAEAAITLLKPIDLSAPFEPMQGVKAQFIQAGHILGAASLHLTMSGADGSQHRLGFSGDLGRPGQLIIPDSEQLPPLDTLFMETTYGARRHKSLVESIDELIGVVDEAYREGGKVIIPAFAVERTQEIIFTLAKAYREGRIPKDMPVFLDSPLAINATRIFRKHPEFFDDETLAILEDGQTPINLPTLKFTQKTEESQAINDVQGPAVIIAGSGMANAGRIKHHLKHNLWKTNTHVVIVGFQAQGTTGRHLVDGRPKVKIFREEVVVGAKVHTIGGFSAHADQEELLAWLTPQVHPGLRVNLMHGEESASLAFKKLAEEKFPEVSFHVPYWKDIIYYGPEAPVEEPVVEVEAVSAAVSQRGAALTERLALVIKRLAAGELAPDEDAFERLEDVLDEMEI